STAPRPRHTYTLPLHDALPIWWRARCVRRGRPRRLAGNGSSAPVDPTAIPGTNCQSISLGFPPPVSFLSDWQSCGAGLGARGCRSEEHTSELQSHLNLVCRLLL